MVSSDLILLAFRLGVACFQLLSYSVAKGVTTEVIEVP